MNLWSYYEMILREIFDIQVDFSLQRKHLGRA